MNTFKTILTGVIALGTLGLLFMFMFACAILPILAVIWLLQLIF